MSSASSARLDLFVQRILQTRKESSGQVASLCAAIHGKLEKGLPWEALRMSWSALATIHTIAVAEQITTDCQLQDDDADADADGSGETMRDEVGDDGDDNPELSYDEWSDGENESVDPSTQQWKEDATLLVSIAKELSTHGGGDIIPLNTLVSDSQDDILKDRYCLVRVALEAISSSSTAEAQRRALPAIVELSHTIVRESDLDGFRCLTEFGVWDWFSLQVSRFNPLHHFSASEFAEIYDGARHQHKEERQLYTTGCRIFDKAATRMSIVLDLEDEKECLPQLLHLQFKDRRTLWTVVRSEAEFDLLLKASTLASPRHDWCRLMAIDSLLPEGSSGASPPPRLGTMLHFAPSDTILRRMLCEMEEDKDKESGCLRKPLLDCADLPSFVARHVCPFFANRGVGYEDMFARVFTFVEKHAADVALDAASRAAFNAIVPTLAQAASLRKLRHFQANAEACCVCLEDTLDRTSCGHAIHVPACFANLSNMLCPCCRAPLVAGESVTAHHLSQLAIQITTTKAENYRQWNAEMQTLQNLYDGAIPPAILHELSVRFNI